MWDLPRAGLEPVSPCIGRWILNHCATREAPKEAFNGVLSVQSVHLQSSLNSQTKPRTRSSHPERNTLNNWRSEYMCKEGAALREWRTSKRKSASLDARQRDRRSKLPTYSKIWLSASTESVEPSNPWVEGMWRLCHPSRSVYGRGCWSQRGEGWTQVYTKSCCMRGQYLIFFPLIEI